MPAPRPYASRVWSISATPPPWAVAFTCQIVRSPNAAACSHRCLEHVVGAFRGQDPREQLEGDRLDLDLFHLAILPHIATDRFRPGRRDTCRDG